MANYSALYKKAVALSQAGDSQGAIEQYTRVVEEILGQDPDFLRRRPDARRMLDESAHELVSRLRWEGLYDAAIRLQERLLPRLPDASAAIRASLATLHLEAGQAEQGLAELHALAEAEPDNAWGWLGLGAALLWLERYPQAEPPLLRAATSDDPQAAATAYRYLFDLYVHQKRLDEAAQAWATSRALDPASAPTPAEAVRACLYWHYYRLAEQFLAHEPSELRRLFYHDLIQYEETGSSEGLWEWVPSVDPAALTDEQDELAEAYLRVYEPSAALALLEPLLERGEIGRQRLLLLGLAWAQKRMLSRATWALDRALRLAHLERPRRSRPDGVGGVILDAVSRMLYGDIVLAPDIRHTLDRYFIPQRV